VIGDQDIPLSWYAPVEGFDPRAWMSPTVEQGTDRFAQFALAASQMALDDAGLDELDSLRTGIVIGTSMGGTRSLLRAQHLLESQGIDAVPKKVQITIWPNMAASQIAMKHKLHGPSMTVCTACASSIDALGTATRYIQAGLADVVIAGAAEGAGDIDYLPATAVSQRTYGMSQPTDNPMLACRPFDRDRTGIASGEGSGFVILESLEHARSRGAQIYARIDGYASLADGYHPSSPDPTGEWEALVMRNALADARLEEGRQIDAVYAHGTGTPAGDIAEIRAINDVHAGNPDLLVTSLKGALGHTGGAAASMNVVAGVTAMRQGRVLPTACTKTVDPEAKFAVVLGRAVDREVRTLQFNAFGFGGQNASMIVSRV
jgi:3-oxoacyl-[acyl-carrier-protein] synthase II